jgi:MFS superfamily sulfate permease-like transporter
VFEALGARIGPAVDDHGGIGVQRVTVSANLLNEIRPVFQLGIDALGFAFVWKGAVTFALIASAETLLCSVAVDSKHTGPRTQYDRELAAQGVGNLICGALGALPMTGVIVRSAANVEAGARTRWSAVMHGAWLLLFVLALPGLLSRIPETALAAVLVFTGWKLLNLPGLWHLWKENRTEALVFVITAGTIVGMDLLAGVVTGLLVSMFVLLIRFSHLEVTRAEPTAGEVVLNFSGAATFIRLPVIAKELDALPQGLRVKLNLEAVQLIDHAVLHLLLGFQKQYALTGGTVAIDWGAGRGPA